MTVHPADQDNTRQDAMPGTVAPLSDDAPRDTTPAPPPFDLQTEVDEWDGITMPGVQGLVPEQGSWADKD